MAAKHNKPDNINFFSNKEYPFQIITDHIGRDRNEIALQRFFLKNEKGTFQEVDKNDISFVPEK